MKYTAMLSPVAKRYHHQGELWWLPISSGSLMLTDTLNEEKQITQNVISSFPLLANNLDKTVPVKKQKTLPKLQNE